MIPDSSLQIIVPFTPYEWNYVRQLFRSRRLSDVKECVIILATWISRTGDSTPVAISCSHVLLQALYAELLSEGMCDSERYMAVDDLRSKHGYGIVRFVNYVNEMGQTRSLLRNMVDSVKTFGIPKRIVDIRHAITHQNCPDIGQLREATNFCLDWLWQNFWQTDARVALNSGKAGTKPSSDFTSSQNGREPQYTHSLRLFTSWRHKNRELTDIECGGSEELQELKTHLLLDAAGFLAVFLRDGQLIQTGAQLKAARVKTALASFEIPDTIQKFWEPLFHTVFSLKLGAELVIALLWRLRESRLAETSRHQLCAYVRMIVEQFADVDIFSDDEWIRVLDHLLPVAWNFSSVIIDLVINHCTKLSRKRRKQVYQILNISTVSEGVGDPNDSVVRTVEDLQKLIKKERRVAPKSLGTKSNGIELCDPDDWNDVPFGMCPGQRVETFTVVVEPSEGRKRKAFDAVITLDGD